MRREQSWKNPRIAAVAAAVFISVAPLASGAEPTELKVLAQRHFVSSFGPISATKAESLVVRSVEELVAASAVGRKAKDPAAAQKDADIQKEVEKQLMAVLMVEKIDWQKQMVILATTDLGAAYRTTPQVILVSLKVSGEKLTITVANGQSEYGAYGRYPGVAAIVERHDGKVEFDWMRKK